MSTTEIGDDIVVEFNDGQCDSDNMPLDIDEDQEQEQLDVHARRLETPLPIVSSDEINIRGLPTVTHELSIITAEDDIPDGPVGEAVASMRTLAIQGYMEGDTELTSEEIAEVLPQLPELIRNPPAQPLTTFEELREHLSSTDEDDEMDD